MEYKSLTEEVKIPVLGIGTWGMGGEFSKDYSSDREDISALKTAISLGMTHIDTAELYANGHSEELVGQAIRNFNRNNLFITTKVWADHLKYNDLIRAAERSLKRMKINYIDLYLVHWPNPNVPLKETVRALDFLVDKGIAKFIGVSNFSLPLLKETQRYSKNKIVSNQVEYNLLERTPEKELLPYCQKEDIMLVAYKPLNRGELAKSNYELMNFLTEKYKKSPAQISLNSLISKPKVVVIPKASTILHLMDNLGAIGWRLEKEDLQKLDKTQFLNRNDHGQQSDKSGFRP